MAEKIRLGLIGASVRTSGYPFVWQLSGADLVRSTRRGLLSGENAVLIIQVN